MNKLIKKLPIPESFPNKEETLTLKLILCKDEEFLTMWEIWKSSVVFDDIDFATLRILPMVYTRLINLGISDELAGKIKGAYRMAWAKNQKTLHSAADAIKLLMDAGIPVMVLKGIPLLVNYYKDTGARFMGDADILVKPGDVKKSIELLRKNNWHYVDKAFESAHNSNTAGIMNVTKETNFQDSNGNEIDVHWGLFHSTNRLGLLDQLFGNNHDHILAFEDLEPRSLPISFAGTSCMMPSHEDSLIHVIAHGSVRNDHRAIRWVTDATAIIRNSSLDWDYLLQQTQKFSFVIEMQVALRYLKETYSVEIPDDFLRTLATIPVKKSNIKRYYKNANGTPYTLLGAFPLLWRTYWSSHKHGSFLKRTVGFLDYSAKSFGLPNKRSLVSFAVKKYIERLTYYLKKIFQK